MNDSLAVVLAAGRGTRMKSDLPKVLYPIVERPMIEYVLDALVAAGVTRVVVIVGYQADRVIESLIDRRATLGDRLAFVHQTELLGTGHAVTFARSYFEHHDGPVFVGAGDGPMMQATSVRRMFDCWYESPVACLLGTAVKENPTGLGRILRDVDGNFTGIVEEKDATDEQRRIREVNMTYYVFRGTALAAGLTQLRNSNAQREYYLTDVPGILRATGERINAAPLLDPVESLAVNTVEEAAAVEAEILRRCGS